MIEKNEKERRHNKNDIPIKLFHKFSFSLWKVEIVTPVPKIHPPEKLEDLRKISGLPICSKVADKIIGELVINDMEPTRDPSQYGNEKKVSAQH